MLKQHAPAEEHAPEHATEATQERVPAAPEATERPRRETREEIRQALHRSSEQSRQQTQRAETREVPPLELHREPEIARRQLDDALQRYKQYLEAAHHQRQQDMPDPHHDTTPVLPNAAWVGAVTGVAPAIASYIAFLQGAPQILTSLGCGAVGGWLGKKYFGHWPYHTEIVAGALTGTALGPPLLSSGLNGYVMPWLQQFGAKHMPSWLPAWLGGGQSLGFGVPAFLSSLVTMPAGAWLGYKLGSKMGSPKIGATLGGSAGFILPPFLGMSGVNAAGIANLTAAIPQFGVTVAGLTHAAALGGVTAASAATLYALGRLEGRMWKRKKTGIIGNLFRGAIAPATIPAWLLWKPAQYLWRNTKQTIRNNVDATKRIFSGTSKGVKAATAVGWWPIRSLYRSVRGVGKGVYNGMTNTPPSETDTKHGFFGKLGRGLGLPIGKIVAAPYRFPRWLLSPTWDWDKH